MPKKKLTPEQITEAYNNWKNSDEWAQMERFMTEKNKIVQEEGGIFDRGTLDICADWTNVLNELYAMIAIMKVPGKKAKCIYNLSTLSDFYSLWAAVHQNNVLWEEGASDNRWSDICDTQ